MKYECVVVVLIACVVLGVLPLQIVPVFCQPIIDGYASGDNPHTETMERMTGESWKLVVNDTIAHDHDFSTTDDVSDDFWMSIWGAADDAGNVYLAFLSNYQLFGVAVWLDFNGDGVFTIGSEPSPLLVSLDAPDFPCLYNFTMGSGYTDPIAGASVAYGFNSTFIEIMVPKVEVEGDFNETVWDCMNWNYMVGVDANADESFTWDGSISDWIATGWGSWCTFTDSREHEMWNGTQWVPLQSWFACPYQPLEECQVTFLTQPAEDGFSINFLGTAYKDGDADTFINGASGEATTNCPDGWVFDHWEVTGNISVSNPAENPTYVNISSSGTIKAVFFPAMCQVIFLTNPASPSFNITFKSETYHNGTIGTFECGTSGPVTANCLSGWEFDHWEVTGNVQVSNVTENPTSVTICCGGTLKAVFRSAQKPPNADFTWYPITPKACEIVTFNASASTPNGGVIVSYKWDFGDGNVTIVTQPMVTHKYGSAGNYTVILNVTDSEGKWDTETKIIEVIQDPKACFTCMHHSLTVTFNASSSYDPDGHIISYCWDFGDGNITTVEVPLITHKYAKPGTYNVTLTVTDDDGLSTSVLNSLTIETFLGDINNDGKVSISDLYIVAKAFGAKPGYQNWNSIADINNDGEVGIEDLYLIAKDFGKTL